MSEIPHSVTVKLPQYFIYSLIGIQDHKLISYSTRVSFQSITLVTIYMLVYLRSHRFPLSLYSNSFVCFLRTAPLLVLWQRLLHSLHRPLRPSARTRLESPFARLQILLRVAEKYAGAIC